MPQNTTDVSTFTGSETDLGNGMKEYINNSCGLQLPISVNLGNNRKIRYGTDIATSRTWCQQFNRQLH